MQVNLFDIGNNVYLKNTEIPNTSAVILSTIKSMMILAMFYSFFKLIHKSTENSNTRLWHVQLSYYLSPGSFADLSDRLYCRVDHCCSLDRKERNRKKQTFRQQLTVFSCYIRSNPQKWGFLIFLLALKIR